MEYDCDPKRPRGTRKQHATSPDGSFGLEHVRISLANKIVAGRKRMGLMQAELAKRSGVRVETISRLENGLNMPSARIFDRLEKALVRSAKKRAV